MGGHLSGTAVARRLKRPTRGSDGTGRPVWGQGQALPPRRPCLALLPVGVAWPPGSPRTPVVSYTAFSPLPAAPGEEAPAGGLFLWPYPSGYPAWVLPSTVPSGARTFLTPRPARSATAWPTWSNFILTYSPAPVKQKRGGGGRRLPPQNPGLWLFACCSPAGRSDCQSDPKNSCFLLLWSKFWSFSRRRPEKDRLIGWPGAPFTLCYSSVTEA